MYAITKNGRYVKDFSNGTEFTTLRNWSWVEKYTTKKGAVQAAQTYGKENGSGYHAVKLF